MYLLTLDQCGGHTAGIPSTGSRKGRCTQSAMEWLLPSPSRSRMYRTVPACTSHALVKHVSEEQMGAAPSNCMHTLTRNDVDLMTCQSRGKSRLRIMRPAPCISPCRARFVCLFVTAVRIHAGTQFLRVYMCTAYAPQTDTAAHTHTQTHTHTHTLQHTYTHTTTHIRTLW